MADSRLKIFIGAFFPVLFFLIGVRFVHASTNISATTTAHWAWNDIIGWIDFYNTQSITVSTSSLTGYASSSVGDISLDCHTTSIGNVCDESSYQVTNDGSGNLQNGAGTTNTAGSVLIAITTTAPVRILMEF